ncbi:unnamed protein product [Peronospora belbahrii]|uniref:Uncharacterized protein n=1 Tax=Peronospora belbahrii TaxID=622444 RepID=A0AAU9KGV0_9STRA|nr:unnamed protein product [Peronospora belbahrii]CAH0521781.1 unnamed protein product [Peronospora belbahrii]
MTQHCYNPNVSNVSRNARLQDLLTERNKSYIDIYIHPMQHSCMQRYMRHFNRFRACSCCWKVVNIA